jgi:hypothetical protein
MLLEQTETLGELMEAKNNIVPLQEDTTRACFIV